MERLSNQACRNPTLCYLQLKEKHKELGSKRMKKLQILHKPNRYQDKYFNIRQYEF